jgi:hypothetical protein
MDPNDDYDDAPRPRRRPTLSEREPAPDRPAAADHGSPGRGGRVPASAILVAGLGYFALAVVWELARDTGVNDLDQPWRFAVKAAMTLVWLGAFATISSLLNRRAEGASRRPGTGSAGRDEGAAVEPVVAPGTERR